MAALKRLFGIIQAAFTVIYFLGGISCLKILKLDVPSLADLRQPVSLGCSYDAGSDALFSVKWYKDDHEFFRFMPNHRPPTLMFPLNGAVLEAVGGADCDTRRCVIRLSHLRPPASGAYTCEVSTEAPTFRTALQTHNMTVAALPLEDPQIEGLRSTYNVGDMLDLTCSSSPSVPPATITWYINNQQVEENQVLTAVEYSEDEFFRSSSRLRASLHRGHFQGPAGALLVQCTASVGAPGPPGTSTPGARSVHASAALAAPQLLHIQKLEWPSGAGKTSASFHGTFCLASVLCLGWRTLSYVL